jgi:release factor glutamine methyltransferase
LGSSKRMIIDEALRLNAKRLSLYSSTPRLDAEVLFAHVLGMGRASLLAHSDEAVSEQALAMFEALIGRREKGEPIAYLTGHKEFYGLDLYINDSVLVPRPETESVVEVCLGIVANEDNSQLADIGTGSGAILAAVGVNRPRLRLFGTDISAQALEIAKRNCERYGLSERVTLYQGHLLEPLPGKVNVIAANLPYVPPGEASPEVATWEPNVAVLGGGDDGTALIREFLAAAPDYLLPSGAIVMEVAYSQGKLVGELARERFPSAHVEVRKDLAGYDRIVVVGLRG